MPAVQHHFCTRRQPLTHHLPRAHTHMSSGDTAGARGAMSTWNTVTCVHRLWAARFQSCAQQRRRCPADARVSSARQSLANCALRHGSASRTSPCRGERASTQMLRQSRPIAAVRASPMRSAATDSLEADMGCWFRSREGSYSNRSIHYDQFLSNYSLTWLRVGCAAWVSACGCLGVWV